MQITISGKGLDAGESLRATIEKRLSDVVHKYLDRVTGGTVVVGRESHLYRSDIVVNPGTHGHIVIKARGEADDAYAACEQAIAKVEKQLRRYKRRLTNHHKARSEGRTPISAKKYVLRAEPDTELTEEPKESALIIAETTTGIEKLTVGEAVMKMDLEDLPAVMFFNPVHGGLNVVYRRADGNISWVDPATAQAS